MAEKKPRIESDTKTENKFAAERWQVAKDRIGKEFKILIANYKSYQNSTAPPAIRVPTTLSEGAISQIKLLRQLADNFADVLMLHIHNRQSEVGTITYQDWIGRIQHVPLAQRQVVAQFQNLTFAQRLFVLWWIKSSRFSWRAKHKAKGIEGAMWRDYWLSMHTVDKKVIIPGIAKMVMDFSGTGFGDMTPGMKKGFF